MPGCRAVAGHGADGVWGLTRWRSHRSRTRRRWSPNPDAVHHVRRIGLAGQRHDDLGHVVDADPSASAVTPAEDDHLSSHQIEAAGRCELTLVEGVGPGSDVCMDELLSRRSVLSFARSRGLPRNPQRRRRTSRRGGGTWWSAVPRSPLRGYARLCLTKRRDLHRCGKPAWKLPCSATSPALQKDAP